MTESTTEQPDAQLAAQLTVGAIGRFVLNTSRRYFYPFAPALSRGLGVPVTAITSMIALNQFAGVMAPLFGPLSDRLGYRFALLLGAGLVAAGMLVSGIFPVYALIVVAFFVAGIGFSIYVPALQAFVGQRVPYQYRGRVIGLVELSWSASSLIGIPLVGLLIDRYGWRSSFWAVGLATLGVCLLLAVLLPAHAGRSHSAATAIDSSLGKRWRLLVQNRVALGALLFGLAANSANDVFFVVYGVWLEHAFDLTVLAVGITTTVIGLAEFSGESLATLLSDRLGLKRSLIGSLALTGLAYGLFPLLAQSLGTALVGLFVIFALFDYTIVTALSLFTEILPDARATMMSGYRAAAGIGRMSGALLGIPIWMAAGMTGIGVTAMVLSALGVIALLWGMRHWQVK